MSKISLNGIIFLNSFLKIGAILRMLLAVVLLLLGTGKIYAQPALTDAEEIIKKVFTQASKNEEIKLDHLTYYRKIIEEEFDNDEFNNKTDPKPKSHKDRVEKVNQNSGNIRVEGQELNLNNVFSTLYSYRLPDNSTAVINGIPCIVVEFYPKDNLKNKNTIDEFTHKLRGRFFIDQDNFNIIRIESAAPEFEYWVWTTKLFVPIPVHIRIKRFEIEFNQKYMSDIPDIPLEDSIRVIAQYELGPFKGTKRIIYQYYGHEFKKK